MERSPTRKEEEEWDVVIREVREGFRELGKKIKDLRESREKIRSWIEEMKKG